MGGIEGDRPRPHLAAAGHRQLVDHAVGAGGVDEATVGVGHRAGGRHLRVARRGVDAPRAKLPQRVSRARRRRRPCCRSSWSPPPSHGGVPCTVIACSSIGAVSATPSIVTFRAVSLRHVGGGDPGVGGANAAATGRVAEVGPVAGGDGPRDSGAGRRGVPRVARGRAGGGRARAVTAAGAGDKRSGDQQGPPGDGAAAPPAGSGEEQA